MNWQGHTRRGHRPGPDEGSWRAVLAGAACVAGLLAAGCNQGSAAPDPPSSPAAPGEAVGQAPAAVGSGAVCVTLQRGAGAAVADAAIDGGKPTKNYGASGSLSAGLSGVAGAQVQALLRFDVSAIPPDATITSAVTTLRVLLYGGAPSRAHRVTAPWSEGAVTWSTFNGASASAVDATFPAASAGQATTADLAALVQGWVSGSVPNHGVLLERDLTGSTVYASSEQPSAQQPQMTVCYTPGPCSGKPAGAACDDGNACTTNDVCVAGRCAGTAVTCGASDPCHAAGTCNQATGQCSNPARADGTACDDGNPSTTGDACAAGACVGVDHCLGVVCAASDSCHTAGTCADHATGACSNPAAPDGTACDDGNPSTIGDVCAAGACAGVDHCLGVVCAPLDACHVAGTCIDHATGACSNPAAPSGTACNDGNACTQSDTCQAGACVGANPVTCPAASACHGAGACNPATGQCTGAALADGTACDDGNACTQRDVCAAGVCAGTAGACSVQGTGNAASATIEAPAAALPPELAAQLAVDEAAPAAAPPLAPGVVEQGPVLEFLPHGVQFASPVTIAVPFTAIPGAVPTLYTSDGVSPWQPVPNAVASGGVMEAQVMHFSVFTVGTSIVDADGDGFSPAQGDCDDNDFTTYPGAPEMCDGRDNNCDGVIDAGRWGWRVPADMLNAPSLAQDALGNTFVAGSAIWDLDLGAAHHPAHGGSDIVVAKIDPQGQVLWSKRFGDAADQQATQVVVDPLGNALVTGLFQGTVDFGGGPLTAGQMAVFLVKLDAGGHHVYSRVLGAWEDQALGDLAVDAAGDAVVLGGFVGSLDLGAGPLAAAGPNDIFLAKLDPTGQLVWQKDLGAPGYPLGLTLSPAGEVYFAAVANGTVDLGGGPLGGPILAKLDGNGQHVWSQSFSSAVQSNGGNGVLLAPGAAGGVAVLTPQNDWVAQDYGYNFSYDLLRFDASGAPVPGPSFQANLVFQIDSVAPGAPGELLITAWSAYSSQFTGKIDATGNLSQLSGYVQRATMDAQGNLIVAGDYLGGHNSVAQIGLGACTTCPSWFRDADGDGFGTTSTWAQACAQPAGYVAHAGDCNDGDAAVHPGAAEVCDGTDNDCDGHVDEGGVAYRRDLGPATSQGGFASHTVAADGSGNAIGAGLLQGTADFGGGPLTSASAGGDMYLVELDASGAHLRSRTFPTTSSPVVAVDGAGNRILAGYLSGTVDLGGGPVTAAHGLFVAKLDPAGQHVWSRVFAGGSGAYASVEDVAVGSAGQIFVSGTYGGTVDLGGGVLPSTGQVFVLALDAQGNHQWSRGYGSGSWTLGSHLAADAAGNVIATAWFSGGPVDFGGGAAGPGGNYAWKLDASGNFGWSRWLPGTQRAPIPAVTAAGHVVLAAPFSQPYDFGGGTLAPVNTSYGSVYLLELDAVGHHVQSRALDLWGVGGLLVDGSGDVILAGAAVPTGPYTLSSWTTPARVLRFDASGALIWTHEVGTIDGSSGPFMSLAAAGGEVLVSAYLYQHYDVAGGQVYSLGPRSMTLTRLAPACF
jgi:hypothetical protein